MAGVDALLKEYRAKRDFAKTAEPAGKKARAQAEAAGRGIFVVQKHDATRLHYDFRLELDGVLKSWAVTKGPSLNPADKRLAVRVEDHPLDYADFEGTIPEGEYGGGTVMLWDFGTWEPIGDPQKGLDKGDLKFRLNGQRLKGEWVLVHMKGRDVKRRGGEVRENWLLIKHRDDQAREEDGITERFTTSVETGRDLAGIAKGLKSKKRASKDAPAARVWTRAGEVKLPAFRPPQLATLVDEVPSGDNWLFEMKYDGYRALAAVAADQVRLYTRNDKDWTERFGRLVEPLSKLTKGSALIDGEVCAITEEGRTDFSALHAALSSGGPLVYFAFDLLEQDGEDLTGLPLSQRKARLKKLIGRTGKAAPIQFSDHVQGNGHEVYDSLCGGGFEGLVAKEADAPYRGERTKSWLKVKCSRRQEFVIGGWRPSEKRNRFASLLLGAFEDGKLVYHGRVGTGFNEKDAAALQAALDRRARDASPFVEVPRDIKRRARWVTPDLVAEIAYTEITPDGALRHPSFLGLREDKPAKSVRLEVPGEEPPPPAKAKAAPRPKAKKAPAHVEFGRTEDAVAAAEAAGVKLTHPERVVYAEQGVTKADLVNYYIAVAPAMLPFVADRPLSLVRCPQGPTKHCFFQKHDTGGFPSGFRKVVIHGTEADDNKYLYIDDLAGLISGVQMNVLEWHVWGSRRDEVEKAERIIFDIDPDEGLAFNDVKAAARDIRDILGALGLKSFPMATGGKGIHVIAPIQRRTDWPQTKAFCRAFSKMLEANEPDRFVAEMSKAKRRGRLFVDYLRNERNQTAIAPYSTRSRAGAPVAVPVSWEELEGLDRANGFSLKEAAARAGDESHEPWPGYFEARQSITKKMMEAIAGM